jgi:hypothetical protein
LTGRLPRWARRCCEHPDAYVTRTGGGLVLREVCPACGTELGAVAFETRVDALAAFRDLVQPRTEPTAATQPEAPVEVGLYWTPAPVGLTMPVEVLELQPQWGRRRAD